MTATKKRIRINAGSTRQARANLHKLARIGTVTKIQGTRYHNGKYTDEAVFVTGTHGTARFKSLCWGYGGEGPHGLRDLLMVVGLKKSHADLVAFNTPRHDFAKLGADWTLELNAGNPGNNTTTGYVTLTTRDGTAKSWQRFEALVEIPPYELLNPNR